MSSKVYVGSVGTEIILDAGIDLTQATIRKIKYRKPDKVTVGEWDGVLVGTTKLKHVVADGDLDQAGRWKLQVYVVLPTWNGEGETASMDVYESFN